MNRPLLIARAYILLWIIIESIAMALGIYLLLLAIYPFHPTVILSLSVFTSLIYLILKVRRFDDREIAWLYEFSHPGLHELLITYVETGQQSLKERLQEHRLKFWKIYKPEWRAFIFLFLSVLSFGVSFHFRKPLYLWKLGYIDRRLDVLINPHVIFTSEKAILFVESKSPFHEKLRIEGPDTQIIHIPPYSTLKDSLRGSKVGRYVVLFNGEVVESLIIVSRPVLESLFIFSRNPYFSGIDTLINDYDFTVPENSKLYFRVIHNGDSAVIEEVDSNLVLLSDTILHIRLFKSGRSYVYPRVVSIRAIKDMPPLVRILVPMERMLYLPEDGFITIGAVSMDDFGLSRIHIRYRFGESKGVLLNMKPDSPLKDTFLRDLNLNSIPMLPGDEILITVEARDVKGQTSSDRLIVRFPTLREQMELSQKEMASDTRNMEDVFRRVEEISQNMERMSRINEQDVKSITQQLREIRKRINDLSRSMEELSRNIPMDEELNQLLEQLDELYDRIIDEQMRSIIEKLQRLSDSITPAERKALLEKIKRDMERLKESLRSTYETLKRFYQEQRLKQISRRLEELAKDQRVALDTSDVRRIAEELKSLKESLDSLSGSIEEPFGDSLASISSDMDSLTMRMEKAMKNSPGGKMNPEDRQELSRRLREIARRMSRLTSTLISSRKSDIIGSLERIKEQVAFLLYNSDVKEYEEQMRIVNGLKTVIRDLKKAMPKNFLISASIYGYLYSALDNAEEALSRLNFLDRKGAHRFVEKERKDMFLSLIEIQNSMNQVSSASSSTGFQEMLRQMSMSIGQQSSFNNRLQMMLGKGKIPMDVLKEMARQQAEIRKQIEGMAGKMEKMGRKGRRYSRELREIASEMEEIEKRLMRGDVNRRLMERQRRILNRLMEAYRGMKSEKVEKERKAERARHYEFRPPEVPEELLMRRRLMEIIRRYPGSRRVMEIYRELLRAF